MPSSLTSKSKNAVGMIFLAPYRSPRRKNAVQIDFLREENRITLKLTPVFFGYQRLIFHLIFLILYKKKFAF